MHYPVRKKRLILSSSGWSEKRGDAALHKKTHFKSA
jgi:hypothetical protein